VRQYGKGAVLCLRQNRKSLLAEFKNPNQQGGGDGNQSLLIMAVIMIAVFVGLQFYKQKTNPKLVSPSAAQSAPATTSGAPSSLAAPSPAKVGETVANPTVPVVQGTAESTTVIENELYRITFSNRGGQVISWILKRFKDSDGKNPLDLVHHQAAQTVGYPLSLYTYDPAVTKSLANALYVSSATGNLAAPASLTFTWSDGSTQVRKTFSFDETYVLHADIEVTRNGAPFRTLLNWPGGFGDQDTAIAYNSAQLDSYRNKSDEHLAFKKVAGGETLNGPFDWAGVSDPYFAAVFLPDSPDTATVVAQHTEIDVAKTIHNTGAGIRTSSKGPVEVPIIGAALGDISGHTKTRIFVGPKAINVLRAIHATDSKVTLEPVLEFGFWTVISKPLFLALQFIHNLISPGTNAAQSASNGSWGWAIIILTILINIVTLPFKIKTMQSGLKMQRIQPQMDAIKEKYKKYKVTDPKRNDMNAEIMELQKANGVNMFGGCIPTLITLPVLWGFFQMLPKVVELRQAHWFWLPDLSASDPLHILPILMVISMFLVQFYTPSPGVDPQQQKMMAFMMPAFTGFFTWNYGSGLALYWSVGNLIGIIQQAVMNRTSLGREMREIAAKRARRKAGTAQTVQGKR
jgi:YidC/Oxa1 family membrane protein insertase